MEDNIHQSHISSDFLDRAKFQKQLDIISKAADIAQQKTDYISAHDDQILRAIDVVEDFLRKTHRLCYGGTAINAHLPAKYKFYDRDYQIPDYDFFTNNQSKDISALVKDLRKAGFTEIYAKEGVHEGTIKIYVNFIPVADITAIDSKLYRILSKREFKIDGISYLDANTLRMLMYLELSRPRGDTSRWSKVFERLSLFNEFVPSKGCIRKRNAFKSELSRDQTSFILNFIIANKRIFCGADLVNFYESALKNRKKNTTWILKSKKPILFYSSDAESDAKIIQSELIFLNKTGNGNGNGYASDTQTTKEASKNIKIKSYSSRGVEIIPSMKIIVQNEKPLVFIIDQTACHSYFNVPIGDGKIMRIASMDTLITLYFSLGLLDSKYFDIGSIECLATELVSVSIKAREKPEEFIFPFISIKCAGHQSSLSSLIRAKVKRITQKKNQLKEILQNSDLESNVKNRRTTVKQIQK
jgi:hypothetical protein